MALRQELGERRRELNGGAASIESAERSARESQQPRSGKRQLRPLLDLLPYILHHKGMVVAALIALLIAAGATLILPLGVRRMIDTGFSSQTTAFIDNYFAMMVVVGLVLAIASSARFYFVSWIGERVVADLRSDVFPQPDEA